MSHRAIQTIMLLMETGLAYTLNIDDQIYVCFDFKALYDTYRMVGKTYAALKPPPVPYAIVKDVSRSDKDCVLWAPYVDGAPSPWGPGLQTVNLKYVMDVLEPV